MSEHEFAGDKLVIEETADRTIFTFDDKGTGRSCGSCTLCCKLLPVPQLGKPANTRCRHQKVAKGCLIYPTLGGNRPETVADLGGNPSVAQSATLPWLPHRLPKTDFMRLPIDVNRHRP